MGPSFIACDRGQWFLMPPDVREWLPEDHFAWFVIEAVAAMDLDAFYAVYRGDGRARPAYQPAMVVALVAVRVRVRGAVLAGDRARVHRGRRLPGDRGPAQARSRDHRALCRAPPGRARGRVRIGARPVRQGRSGGGERG